MAQVMAIRDMVQAITIRVKAVGAIVQAKPWLSKLSQATQANNNPTTTV
ncbi:19_t:CDS:2 [Acaulospora morrowiae]|uniref:19_t:CDS:1 n=1 Tax=Acaulospora morrowiae TaxID=94023 RepID=A0A9N9GEF1_9GLOM|nr:19_t:CDS:2 [Acaulospora morrowiae]